MSQMIITCTTWQVMYQNGYMHLYDQSSYEFVSTVNPSVNDVNNQRKVIRGGSWKDVAYYLASKFKRL